MKYVAQFMRIFPLALIGAGCLFLAMNELRNGAGIPAVPLSALSSK
jgi:hypothetical protein